MAARRLEDRIRQLCVRLLIEHELEWSLTAKELQLTLQEHTLRMRNRAAAVFAGTRIVERRKN